ncbi:Immunoglobulin-like fold containing protein [Trema orientale]|uniref:Immunoglobulin-like fold containing protein n=1 Tax=Trema orientale TaxID=63057 RepID=A0A2P5FIZ8_TREOI|nr:Immunoglobulin-like fold containing protein [Trema orientale]
MLESEKFKRSQNAKCYAYILAFVVFQVAVILIFSLTVMRVKTPSVRLRSVQVQSLNINDNTTNPHFDMTLVAEIAIRNKNFGHFRFDNAAANVTYGGVTVGDGEIVKARASARKTKRMNVTLEVSSSGRVTETAKLSDDLRSGNLTLTSVARVRGKVTLMKVMKKKKTANMNCTMTVNLATRAVHDLDCE